MGQITIKDIANICGVGVSTVSRAINNHPDINPETKEKINNVIKEYGYVPNDSARNLKRTENNSIALLIKGIGNPFFQEMMPVMENIAKERNYDFLVTRVNEEDNEVKIAQTIALEKRLKGVALLGASFINTEEDIKKVSVPMVFCTLGNMLNVSKDAYSSVSIDDYVETKIIVEHLIELGHKKIVFIGGREDDRSISHLRLEAYKDALKEHDIPFDKNIVRSMKKELEPYSAPNGYSVMKDILADDLDFTAVFALSDSMAMGAMRAIFDIGKKVPEDYSVAGFDGTVFSQYTNPTLTTMKQPADEIMKETAKLLFDLIEGKETNKHIILPARLIKGGSTRRI